MAKNVVKEVNPFLVRCKPNKAFSLDLDFAKRGLDSPIYHNSKTDKEAYRVTLVSARSAILASNNPANSGTYGFPAGTNIETIRKYDDSYFRRPDLTLADIDQAIRDLKESCEGLDEKNKLLIQKDIERAEAIQKELEDQKKADSKPKSESGSSD